MAPFITIISVSFSHLPRAFYSHLKLPRTQSQYYLFDLIADPYETNNLYDSADETLVAAKENLYSYLQGFVDKSTELTSYMRGNQVAFQVWREHGDFIVPWVKMDDLDASKGSFPSDCYVEVEVEVEEEDEEDTDQSDAAEEAETESEDVTWAEETGLVDFTTSTANSISALGDVPTDASSTSSTTSASTSTSTTATTITDTDVLGLSSSSTLPALTTGTSSTTTSTDTSGLSGSSTLPALTTSTDPTGTSSSSSLPALTTTGTTSTTYTAPKMATNPSQAKKGVKPKGASSTGTSRTRTRKK